MPVLTLHAGRRGGITLAVKVGIDKMTIKRVGQWATETVDEYFQPARAGIGFTERALREL